MADLLVTALACLDLLADDGDATARHAAAVLRGQRKVGRKPVNDRAALKRVAALVIEGRDRRAAVGIVAREIADTTGQDVGTIARRLRRKRKI